MMDTWFWQAVALVCAFGWFLLTVDVIIRSDR